MRISKKDITAFFVLFLGTIVCDSLPQSPDIKVSMVSISFIIKKSDSVNTY